MEQREFTEGRVDRRPAVAQITRAYLPPTETFIYNQVASLRRYRPVVVCHHRREGGFAIEDGLVANEAIRPAIAKLDAIADRVFRAPLAPATAAMARFIVQRDVRLLHFHFLTNARSYLALQRRTGLPAVVSAYGYDVSSFPRRWGGLGRAYLAPIFSKIDCFLAMSEEMRRDLVDLGCPEELIRVHYHGVDTKRFAHPERRYAAGDDPVTVLSCGRLMEVKGQDRLVEALGIVHRRSDIPFRLVLVGDGPLRAAVEATIRRLGMKGVVDLLGHVPYGSPELVRRYREADVFALASAEVDGQREGIPGTIVEGMAAGLPVVSTLHGGIPAVVSHERDGLLVPERHVATLADALERLIVDARLRERLGTAAAARAAADFDLVPATAALERIYDSLL